MWRAKMGKNLMGVRVGHRSRRLLVASMSQQLAVRSLQASIASDQCLQKRGQLMAERNSQLMAERNSQLMAERIYAGQKFLVVQTSD